METNVSFVDRTMLEVTCVLSDMVKKIEQKAKRQEYYQKNKEMIIQKQLEYYRETKAERVEYQVTYQTNKKEKVDEYNSSYYQKNKEKLKQKRLDRLNSNSDSIC